MVPEVDAIILGASPAGAKVALNLAPFRSVLVLERRAEPVPRIGESLPAAARRLLIDMGLWEGFQSDGHLPCHAKRSVWGGSDPVEVDTIHDPDGPGWHLDRARFECRLRATAAARGAAILAPARAGRIERGGAGWTVEVLHDGGTFEIRARLLIDGRGRSAKPLAATKAGRRVVDRLVCGWITGADPRATGFAGIIYTEAERDGWWYGAPLPGGRRILALHTDADLPAAADASNPRRLAERAPRVSIPAAALPNTGFAPVTDSGFCAAHGSRLDPPSGDGWFAVGDACLALDPLSSQGLLNALFTGLAAAEASDRILSGQAAACGDYKLNIDAIWNAYAHLMPAWYGQERRWRDQPFWRRRATPGSHAEARIAR